MDELPDEIMHLIMALLPGPTRLRTLPAVCRRWRALALDPAVMGDLQWTLQRSPETVPRWLVTASPHVRRLYLNGFNLAEATNLLFLRFAPHRQLRTLDIRVYSMEKPDKETRPFLEDFPLLKTLRCCAAEYLTPRFVECVRTHQHLRRLWLDLQWFPIDFIVPGTANLVLEELVLRSKYPPDTTGLSSWGNTAGIVGMFPRLVSLVAPYQHESTLYPSDGPPPPATLRQLSCTVCRGLVWPYEQLKVLELRYIERGPETTCQPIQSFRELTQIGITTLHALDYAWCDPQRLSRDWPALASVRIRRCVAEKHGSVDARVVAEHRGSPLERLILPDPLPRPGTWHEISHDEAGRTHRVTFRYFGSGTHAAGVWLEYALERDASAGTGRYQAHEWPHF